MTAADDGRRPPKFADADEVRRVAVEWAAEFLECRDTGHHWQPEDVTYFRAAGGYYRVVHVCARCGMRRLREISERGHVYASSYDYPAGYVAVGLGRIAGEAKDAVRLAAITRGYVKQVKRRPREEDRPRFAATRRDLEPDDD